MAISVRVSQGVSLVGAPLKMIEGPSLGDRISKSDSNTMIDKTGGAADFDMSVLGAFDVVEPIGRAQDYFNNSSPESHSLDSVIDVYDQDY